MSTQTNTIKLDASVIAALREAAEREHKSLEEMAGEAIMRGLSIECDAEWRELIAFGHEQGKKSGIREEDVSELIHEWRRDRPAIPRLPDMSDLWRRFPSVDGDSGRFLEEDR